MSLPFLRKKAYFLEELLLKNIQDEQMNIELENYILDLNKEKNKNKELKEKGMQELYIKAIETQLKLLNIDYMHELKEYY